MATVQLRNPTEGRAYFDRKKAAGKTSMEAMRALKRRLSDIVYRQLLADALTPSATGPREPWSDLFEDASMCCQAGGVASKTRNSSRAT
jgi:hypothetical protein